MKRGAWQECPGCGHYLVLVDRQGNKVGLCPECDGSWSRPLTKEEIENRERKCECSLRIRLVGDGCDICNPTYAQNHVAQWEDEGGAL